MCQSYFPSLTLLISISINLESHPDPDHGIVQHIKHVTDAGPGQTINVHLWLWDSVTYVTCHNSSECHAVRHKDYKSCHMFCSVRLPDKSQSHLLRSADRGRGTSRCCRVPRRTRAPWRRTGRGWHDIIIIIIIIIIITIIMIITCPRSSAPWWRSPRPRLAPCWWTPPLCRWNRTIILNPTVGSNLTKTSYSTPALLALIQNPTALPGLPGVVVSVFVQHSRCRFLDKHKVLSDATI